MKTGDSKDGLIDMQRQGKGPRRKLGWDVHYGLQASEHSHRASNVGG